MEETVTLEKIEPIIENIIYNNAKQSYSDIYNICMSKGKRKLDPKSLGGNPIQMDINNINSLFVNTNNSSIKYADYLVSTKADGMRFMMMIGNPFIDGNRKIYFVDNKLNFFHIEKMALIPPRLNIDKCLIDGEILFWGNSKIIKVNGSITGYKLTKYKSDKRVYKPLISFLAFDILFGSIGPEYDYDPEKKEYKFQLKNSVAMVGPKALDRWPASRRRHVLEETFFNKNSPLWSFIHEQLDDTLNKIERTKNSMNDIIYHEHNPNFTIFVSPFVNMDELLTNNIKESKIYSFMINKFTTSLEEQFFVIFNGIKKITQLPPTEINVDSGRGLSTDGLIFTPTNENYLQGSWTFCNNKQFKWKPIDDLTIDFMVGDNFAKLGENFLYKGLIKKNKENLELKYKDDTDENAKEMSSVIKYNDILQNKSIVECIYSHTDENNKIMIFNFVRKREDKTEPNAYLTAISVINAMDINNRLDFLKSKKGSKKSILDLLVYIKKHNNNPDDEILTNLLLYSGKNKILKNITARIPLGIFMNKEKQILDLITKRQKNNKFELEMQINLNNPLYNYTNCLINSFIKSGYTPVPVIKIYDKNKNSNLRSVYVLLGNELVFEETIKKTQKDKVSIENDVYNYDFDFVLSEEIQSDIEIPDNNKGNYEYQNRHTILSFSEYWRIDIIEYGNSKDLRQAKLFWELSPRVRLELEYVPGSMYKDILNWDNFEFSKLINVGSYKNINKEIVIDKLQKYIKEVGERDPNLILEDLAKMLIIIFDTLDMELGNHSTYKKYIKENIVEVPEVHKSSVFKRMRKFHNYIKEQLIMKKFHTSYDDEKTTDLLDISVGKGGDLFKWNKAGINNVYGIDPHGDSIKEAEKRYNEAKKTGSIEKNRDYKFEKIAIVDTQIRNGFDMVSCQFTMHYFFESDEILNKVIKHVSDSLEIGGYFIGTSLDGNKVKKYESNDSKYIKVEKHENYYIMKYLEEGMYSQDLKEYYVDFNKLDSICLMNNLHKVERIDFEELYSVYKGHKGFKKDDNLFDYEMNISKLNSTFVYRKQKEESEESEDSEGFEDSEEFEEFEE